MASKSLRERALALRVAPVLEQVKTIVFVYVVLSRLIKVHRHLRARGLRTTLVEYWTWMTKVRGAVSMRAPWLTPRAELPAVCAPVHARPAGQGGARHQRREAHH